MNQCPDCGAERPDDLHTCGQQPAQQQEPMAWMLEWTFNGEERGRRLYDDETHCVFDAGNDGGVCRPLYTSPPANKPWAQLMRGVRVEGDTVIISVKGGNENARLLCGELLREKNA